MLPTHWRVFLENEDISKKVADISDISSALDSDEPTEFNTANARLVINYPFPDALRNFARVRINAGTKIVFVGRILIIDKDVSGHTADVIVSDDSEVMRSEALENFGISKRVRITKTGDTDSGEYPFTNILAPVSDNSLINGRVGGTFYDSGILLISDDADNDDPINFGEVSDIKITRVAWGDGYIYRTTQALESLKIRVEGDVNANTVIDCRYSATQPTEKNEVGGIVITPTNLTTHGTPLFSFASVRNSFEGEGVIDSPGSGMYFWLYPHNDVTVSNHRLIFDFGSDSSKALRFVDHFVTEGHLEPTNINYDENTIRSEGQSLDENPIVTIKVPYRNKNVTFLVNKILDHYDAGDNADVFSDLFTIDDFHFSTNGRVGYDLEHNADESNPLAEPIDVEGLDTSVLFWRGKTETTDMFKEGNDIYFLRSGRSSLPSIIKHHETTDEYSEVFTRDSHAEWWKFVKEGNIFYILGTLRSNVEIGNPTLGAYDPTENNPATLIERLDTQTNTLTTYISSSHIHRPVVGMYYQFGFFGKDSSALRQGIQPDSRKGFIYYDNALYYLYANNLNCGIAKATAHNTSDAFVPIPKDGRFNHLGLDFTIENDVLYGAAIFQKEPQEETQEETQKKTRSSRIVFKKDL